MNPREVLLAKRKRETLEGALSSGSTLLNLACTDRPDVCFMKGGYYYLVGDSASGKTFLTMTCFAEACINPAFKKHRLIFDNVEGGALMDFERFFGKEAARRIEPPAKTKSGRPIHSDTVESFYYHIMDLLREREPFIYVLDSQDSLTSGPEIKKFVEQRKAAADGDESKGSYGDGKAKYHSSHLRQVLARIRKMGCILIIIGQTRDNLGMSFDPKTRSGGKALRFYANLEIWTSVAGKIKKKVRGKDRTVGADCLAEVKKNRVTGKIGKDRSVALPIYYDLGIDDIGSCVDFLIDEQHWLKTDAQEGSKKTCYHAKDIMFKGTRGAIIEHIEEEDLEQRVRKITGEVWKQIEAECTTQRKKRYE